MQTIQTWLQLASEKIPRLDAELILCEYLQKDRASVLTHNDPLGAEILLKCNRALEERENNKPLAIIFDRKEFYGRNFWLNDGKVLTPRAESEDIIELAKNLANKHNIETILDIGTGSGCLAITLALELPDAAVYAFDVSDDALKTAAKNAEELGANISIQKSNLLEKASTLPDLIVANLPYVDREWDWLDKETLSYEPSLALYAENGGLALIFKLIEQIAHLKNGDKTRFLILEADTSQHQAIIAFAKEHGFILDQNLNFILQFSY